MPFHKNVVEKQQKNIIILALLMFMCFFAKLFQIEGLIVNKIKRITIISAIAFCCGLGTQMASAATSAAYSSLASRAMLVSAPNTWYTSNFPIPVDGVVGTNPAISIIYYSYSLGQAQVGSKGTLTVQLCQGSTVNCTDISAAKSGSTTAFKGKSPSIPFFLYYKVSSSKATGTIAGSGTTQVTVNYSITE